MLMFDWTTIRISREIRDTLAEIGSKKETYDDVIRRLVKKGSDQ